MAAKTGKTNRKSRYSAEQIAEFRERDAALADAADEALASEDIAERAAAVVLAGGYKRMAGYSLRNQAMLIEQTAKLGMPLTDVDTYNGWAERGRVVKEKAKLWIARPITGAKKSKDAEAAETSDQEDTRPMFRMSARWELSQTEALTDADTVAAGEQFETAADDAAVEWFARLTRDAEQLGYTVETVPAEVACVGIDDDAQIITVTVVDDQSDEMTRDQLTGLAKALAQRISTDTAARKAKKNARSKAETVPVLRIA